MTVEAYTTENDVNRKRESISFRAYQGTKEAIKAFTTKYNFENDGQTIEYMLKAHGTQPENTPLTATVNAPEIETLKTRIQELETENNQFKKVVKEVGGKFTEEIIEAKLTAAIGHGMKELSTLLETHFPNLSVEGDLNATAQKIAFTLSAQAREITDLKAKLELSRPDAPAAPALADNEAIIGFTDDQIKAMKTLRKSLQVLYPTVNTEEPGEVLTAAVQLANNYITTGTGIANQFKNLITA